MPSNRKHDWTYKYDSKGYHVVCSDCGSFDGTFHTETDANNRIRDLKNGLDGSKFSNTRKKLDRIFPKRHW